MGDRRKHSADDVVRKLRQTDELAAAGKTNEEIAGELQVMGGDAVQLATCVRRDGPQRYQ